MSFGCPRLLEPYREHPPGYEKGNRQNGMLMIRNKGLAVIFSDGDGWEHVSVSRRSKTPSYEDMDWIKREFWDDDDCVMQLHVPVKDHIDCHPNCLHLWRPTDMEIPRPPAIMVGPPT